MPETPSRLEKAADAPKSFTQDGTTANAHSLAEQIQLDSYLASKKANKRKGFPFRVFRIKPPGASR